MLKIRNTCIQQQRPELGNEGGGTYAMIICKTKKCTMLLQEEWLWVLETELQGMYGMSVSLTEILHLMLFFLYQICPAELAHSWIQNCHVCLCH